MLQARATWCSAVRFAHCYASRKQVSDGVHWMNWTFTARVSVTQPGHLRVNRETLACSLVWMSSNVMSAHHAIEHQVHACAQKTDKRKAYGALWLEQCVAFLHVVLLHFCI